jgi:phytanoyl-CoA hydroxylase
MQRRYASLILLTFAVAIRATRVPFAYHDGSLPACVVKSWRGGGGDATTADASSSSSASLEQRSNLQEQNLDPPEYDSSSISLSSSSSYGRIQLDNGQHIFRLTPEQIETYHREGCVIIPDVLTPNEVDAIAEVFDRFMTGEIPVPDKDFCDMSQPFGVPRAQWNMINCMLPTHYYPAWKNNMYEQLATSMARQLYPHSDMVQDYDQLLNKLPGKSQAIFAWHQDMAYWPGTKALGVNSTDTCTFSLAVDDSHPDNGCLRYVAGSHIDRILRPHTPLCGAHRDEGHALAVDVHEDNEPIRYAPARRGSVTIHNEYVVHGSGGNTSPHCQRRTYVVAFRAAAIVQAERAIGFTHSHNDVVNWDTFLDGESHRIQAFTKERHESEL